MRIKGVKELRLKGAMITGQIRGEYEPILNIFVPQAEHTPWVAGLPFFSKTAHCSVVTSIPTFFAFSADEPAWLNLRTMWYGTVVPHFWPNFITRSTSVTGMHRHDSGNDGDTDVSLLCPLQELVEEAIVTGVSEDLSKLREKAI